MARLTIRADGGPAIGAGHLARCLALAQAWRDRGGDVTLVSHDPPDEWVRRYEAEGVEVGPVDGSWLDGEADWVAVDGYDLGAAEGEASDRGERVLAVDDFGIAGSHKAALVLDQNLDVAAGVYEGTPALLGPKYGLLRREFRSGEVERAIPDVARRLLVAVGGFPSNEVRAVVEEAARRASTSFDIEWLEGRDSVLPAMAAADMALAASGSTAWELCCMGLPAVLVSVADNQRPIAQALAARGLAVDAGPVADVDAQALAGTLDALAADVDRRRTMADGGRGLVDGRGALRVVTRMTADLLSLAPATAEDCRLLWEWVNDAEVRRRAFSTAPIPWETHVKWFEERLRDPDCRIWIAWEAAGPAIGQVRFQRDGDVAEIAVSVGAPARGRGLAGPMIDAGVRRLFEETDVGVVLARVKPDNPASARSFEVAAFEPDGEGSDDRNTWLRYARRRDADGR